jgi:four helix bundle protein
MNTYKDLIVWQKAINFVVEIYRITSLFPNTEKFGLVSQMRRASISIPSNIAEGYARKNRKENAQFINIAYASGTELETQIIISKKLNLVIISEWTRSEELLSEIQKMLYCYRQSLYTQ